MVLLYVFVNVCTVCVCVYVHVCRSDGLWKGGAILQSVFLSFNSCECVFVSVYTNVCVCCVLMYLCA